MERTTATILDPLMYRDIKNHSLSDNISHGVLIGADSGYSSNSNLTLSYLSPNVTPYRSASNSLVPITEGVELQSFHQDITPTTRNIQKINSFHITTPTSLTPVKHYGTSKRCFEYTPEKYPKRVKSTNTTPTHSTRSIKNRQDSFRNKLNTSNSFDCNYDDENIENENFKMELSPINPNKSSSKVLQENQQKLYRKASDHSMQSSTPKDCRILNKFNTNTVARTTSASSPKTRIIRKTQSFSPSKYFKTKLLGLPKKENDIILELPTSSMLNDNPAKKLLDFSINAFQNLVQDGNKKSHTLDKRQNNNIPKPMLVRQNAVEVNYALNLINNSNILQNLSDVSTNIEVFNKKTDSYVINTVTPKNDSNYSITSNKKIDQILNTSIVPDSPYLTQQYTPKKIRRSTSLNQSNPTRERNNILYSHLPCTPPKNNRKRLLKRIACITDQPSPAKRKLYEIPTQLTSKKTYYGIERLDILSRLARTMPAIDLILGYLSNTDLVNVCKVSSKWRKIVENNCRANVRRHKCLKLQMISKENVHQNIRSNKQMLSNRVPFSRCNFGFSTQLTVDIPKSPPVSPSKRRFIQNQKIIQSIDSNTRVTKCPRCASLSIIITAQQNNSSIKTHKKSSTKFSSLKLVKSLSACQLPFSKSQSFDLDFDCDHSSIENLLAGDAGKNSPYNEGDGGEFGYAKCTGKCSFIFCIQCLCAYNAHHICLVTPVGSMSPTNDNDNRIVTVAGSKQSKRYLRRLCSIDKV